MCLGRHVVYIRLCTGGEARDIIPLRVVAQSPYRHAARSAPKPGAWWATPRAVPTLSRRDRGASARLRPHPRRGIAFSPAM
eukprot:9274695-Alexandrium_andersonii.AAC.1